MLTTRTFAESKPRLLQGFQSTLLTAKAAAVNSNLTKHHFSGRKNRLVKPTPFLIARSSLQKETDQCFYDIRTLSRAISWTFQKEKHDHKILLLNFGHKSTGFFLQRTTFFRKMVFQSFQHKTHKKASLYPLVIFERSINRELKSLHIYCVIPWIWLDFFEMFHGTKNGWKNWKKVSILLKLKYVQQISWSYQKQLKFINCGRTVVEKLWSRKKSHLFSALKKAVETLNKITCTKYTNVNMIQFGLAGRYVLLFN